MKIKVDERKCCKVVKLTNQIYLILKKLDGFEQTCGIGEHCYQPASQGGRLN